MSKADVLRTARKNLPGHWHQGSFSNGTGDFCAYGHIAYAMGRLDGDMDEEWDGNDEMRQTAYMLEKIVKEQYPEFDYDWGSTVPEWNDDPRRTEDEVIAIFDKAVAEAEALV